MRSFLLVPFLDGFPIAWPIRDQNFFSGFDVTNGLNFHNVKSFEFASSREKFDIGLDFAETSRIVHVAQLVSDSFGIDVINRIGGWIQLVRSPVRNFVSVFRMVLNFSSVIADEFSFLDGHSRIQLFGSPSVVSRMISNCDIRNHNFLADRLSELALDSIRKDDPIEKFHRHVSEMVKNF
jgi:hypothetical protein